MSDHDEQPEWDTFKWRYAPRGHFCLVCASRAATQAWARGEHDVRPDDGSLRNEITFGLEAEKQRMEAKQELWALQMARHDEEMQRIRDARDARRRQDPDPT